MPDDDDPYRVEYPMNVVLTRCKFKCSRCKKWKPAARFGLRADGDVIRNQPQCKSCRKKPPLSLVKS